ncbi:anthranilate/para-aminobenzoate synthase component I [Methylorubrum extorquens]|nr:anthranilate/para-aminobenzoate synthase component I [Methylorubrum extorquens]
MAVPRSTTSAVRARVRERVCTAPTASASVCSATTVHGAPKTETVALAAMWRPSAAG